MRLIAPIRTSESGANAFLGLADDDRSYWVKVPGNAQGDTILSAEQIVSAVAQLIGAPARETTLIEIPTDLMGWEYAKFHRLRKGVAHASLLLPAAEESDQLIYPKRDNNPSRVPAFFALWDWCMGEDEQWLFDLSGDMSIWTFDHGWWLGGGPAWDAGSFEQMADRDWHWTAGFTGCDPVAFETVAKRLEQLTPEQILKAVSHVPAEWDVSNHELESVAWVLYRRRQPVAERLRELSAKVSS